MGDGVTTVEEDAYRDNPLLKTASVGQSLKTLHRNAFYLNPNPSNRPKVKVNIRGGRNPNDLKDSDYHIVDPHKHVNLTFDDNGGVDLRRHRPAEP